MNEELLGSWEDSRECELDNAREFCRLGDDRSLVGDRQVEACSCLFERGCVVCLFSFDERKRERERERESERKRKRVEKTERGCDREIEIERKKERERQTGAREKGGRGVDETPHSLTLLFHSSPSSSHNTAPSSLGI